MPYQTRGLVLEDHTCRATGQPDGARIMQGRTRCFCEPEERDDVNGDIIQNFPFRQDNMDEDGSMDKGEDDI